MTADIPRPERGDHIRRIIFPARRRARARAELQRTLAPTIAQWLAATCTWDGDALIGDHRFVVFAIDVAPRVQVYIQFWSEPAEPVLWEVSSGRWNPPADQWLAGERSDRIAAFGFQIGGKAENFRREVEIRTRTQAARVARTVVDIMYDGFDYRGQQPVQAQLVYDSRAELQATYDGFTPEDLAKIFEACLFHVESVSADDEAPVLRVRRRGITTTVTCLARVPEQRLYGAVALGAALELPAGNAAALQGTMDIAFGAGDELEFGKTLVFDGGVTADWLARRISDWDEMTWSCRQEARKRRKPVAAPVSPLVH